ncbi:MAG: hypothetical protein ISS72_06280 [Candidatus Brocadiae bacterium]|nr:hypothetical protein [Candidatus Brocadiia bacterium]
MPPTAAYIDPMSGAIVLQLVIAGVIGVFAFFRHSIWGTIRMIFHIKPKTDEAAEAPASADAPATAIDAADAHDA